MKKHNHAALRYQVLAMLHNQGPMNPTEITEQLADFFGLDEEERNETYEGRPYDKVFYKSVATNEQHLKAAGLVEFSNYGYHSISERGEQALKENESTSKLELRYLRQFPEYCQWALKFRKAPDNHDIIDDFFKL